MKKLIFGALVVLSCLGVVPVAAEPGMNGALGAVGEDASSGIVADAPVVTGGVVGPAAVSQEAVAVASDVPVRRFLGPPVRKP